MILMFFLGVQPGVILGAMLRIRYLRREIAADIGPRLLNSRADGHGRSSLAS